MKKLFSLAIILSLFLLILIPKELESKTIRVPQDYPTLGAALLNAEYGDIVLISEGVFYFENEPWGPIYIPEGVTLSGSGPDKTIITTSLVEIAYYFWMEGGSTIRNFRMEGGEGGGIVTRGTGCSINNIIFYNMMWGVFTNYINTKIINNTFIEIDECVRGWVSPINIDVRNNIFAYNYDTLCIHSEQVLYNNFWQNSDNYCPAGNLSVDPLFVSYPSNLSLSENSLCRDAGDPMIQDPDGSRSDIGAYGGADAIWEAGEAIPGTGIFVDPSYIQRKWKVEIVADGDELIPGSPADIKCYDITQDYDAEELFHFNITDVTDFSQVYNKTIDSFEAFPEYSDNEIGTLINVIIEAGKEIVVALYAPAFAVSFGVWSVTHNRMSYYCETFNLYGITACQDDLIYKGACPVDFEVQDPKGRKLGKNVNEIPFASYLEIDINNDGELDVEINIPDPIYGRYKIEAIQKEGVSEKEDFSLEAILGDIKFQLAKNVQIKDIPINPYRVSFSNVTIPGTLDIDPNTLNLKSKGRYITCYIELPLEYNVTGIEPFSITLTADGDEIIEVERNTPYEIGDHDEDGIPDLTVKFSREKIKSIVSVGKNILLCEGILTDDVLFIASDIIFVK